ncbi:MAG: Lipolytic protein family, partial [Verrucomicrobiaceae bacterium]|nr:Lipolytic protein family [Verrucomicrobiaceae bacterium]
AFWNGQNQTYDAAKAKSPMQDAIARSGDFVAASGNSWQRYFANVNFTGGNAPGSVDFAAVTHARTSEGGCAARWIFSERARPLTIDLSVQAFAGNLHLATSVNGTEVYAGVLTSEPKKRTTVQARLRKGWNVLVCDTSHMQWQWQFSADLKGIDGDALEDLRYSALPQNP